MRDTRQQSYCPRDLWLQYTLAGSPAHPSVSLRIASTLPANPSQSTSLSDRTHVRYSLLSSCGGEKPACPRCRAPLSVRHVLLDCPHLYRQRETHFGASGPQLTIESLLGDDSPIIDNKPLFVFVKSSGLRVVYSPQDSYDCMIV